jgi:hypothetical protein
MHLGQTYKEFFFMKVLKQKKTSLLFGRMLVILSILALAFAFGGCSNSSSSDDGPGGPPQCPYGGRHCPVDCTGDNCPLAHVEPFVVEIQLMNPDFHMMGSGTDWNIGFQGQPVNLLGAVVRVRWNRTHPEQFITITERNQGDFFTQPRVYERAGRDMGPFQIRHVAMNNFSLPSNTFNVGYVVRLSSFNLAFPQNRAFLADQRPYAYDEFTAAGNWRYLATYTDEDWYTPSVAPPPHRTARHRIILTCHPSSTTDAQLGIFGNSGEYVVRNFTQAIPFSDSFPTFDFRNFDRGEISANIGFGDPRGAYSAALLVVPVTDQGNAVYFVNEKSANLVNLNLVHVHNVEMSDPGSFHLLDDQFRFARIDPMNGIDQGTWQDVNRVDEMRSAIFRMLDESNARFTVHYRDGAAPPRIITWQEFQANRLWWDRDVRGVPPAGANERYRIWVAGDPLVYRTGSPDNGTLDTLPRDDPNGTWGFTLAYVGTSFSQGLWNQPLPGDFNDRLIVVTPRFVPYRFTRFRTPADGGPAVVHRFANTQTFPMYRQLTSQELHDSLMLLRLESFEYAQLASRTEDNLPRSILQLGPEPGETLGAVLEDIRTHYELWGVYTRNGATPITRQMTFVSDMFDETGDRLVPQRFNAWPTTPWVTDFGRPTRQWELTVQWRGESAGGIMVNVRPSNEQDPARPIRFARLAFVDPLIYASPADWRAAGPGNRMRAFMAGAGGSLSDFLATNANGIQQYIYGGGLVDWHLPEGATFTDTDITWTPTGFIRGQQHLLNVTIRASSSDYVFTPDFGVGPLLHNQGEAAFWNAATHTEFVIPPANTEVIRGGYGPVMTQWRHEGAGLGLSLVNGVQRYTVQLPIQAYEVIDALIVDVDGGGGFTNETLLHAETLIADALRSTNLFTFADTAFTAAITVATPGNWAITYPVASATGWAASATGDSPMLETGKDERIRYARNFIITIPNGWVFRDDAVFTTLVASAGDAWIFRVATAGSNWAGAPDTVPRRTMTLRVEIDPGAL